VSRLLTCLSLGLWRAAYRRNKQGSLSIALMYIQSCHRVMRNILLCVPRCVLSPGACVGFVILFVRNSLSLFLSALLNFFLCALSFLYKCTSLHAYLASLFFSHILVHPRRRRPCTPSHLPFFPPRSPPAGPLSSHQINFVYNHHCPPCSGPADRRSFCCCCCCCCCCCGRRRYCSLAAPPQSMVSVKGPIRMLPKFWLQRYAFTVPVIELDGCLIGGKRMNRSVC